MMSGLERMVRDSQGSCVVDSVEKNYVHGALRIDSGSEKICVRQVSFFTKMSPLY